MGRHRMRVMVKILLVDDLGFFQKLYGDHLREAGFEVVTASRADEAVDKIRTEKPSLVFMDYYMPEATGGDALNKIKADDSIKNVPVVMLTSVDADAKGEDLLLQGAVAYLMKDKITPKEVVDKAKEILGTSKQPLDPKAG